MNEWWMNDEWMNYWWMTADWLKMNDWWLTDEWLMNDSVRAVPYHKMSCKGRTDLLIGGSEAKYRQESAGDVQKFAAPQNLIKNPPQTNFRTKKNPKTNVGKWNDGDCLKWVLAKFRGVGSEFWRVDGRLKFYVCRFSMVTSTRRRYYVAPSDRKEDEGFV